MYKAKKTKDNELGLAESLSVAISRPDKQSPNKEKELYTELDKESYQRLINYATRDKKGNIILENAACKVQYNKASQSPSRRPTKTKKANANRPVRTTKVEPLSDGTFNFKSGQEEYDAIMIFLAINSEIDYFKERGLKDPPNPIVVLVDKKQ